MAEAVNPTPSVRPAAPSDEVPVKQVPGLLAFAAVMMFLLGGFQLTWALVEFWNALWFGATVYGTYGGYLWLWGILDVLVALAAIYAGFDLLQGGTFGKTFGVLIAGFSAIRWFFAIPVAPVAAIVVIAIDVLIIYGILAHADYRDATE